MSSATFHNTSTRLSWTSIFPFFSPFSLPITLLKYIFVVLLFIYYTKHNLIWHSFALCPPFIHGPLYNVREHEGNSNKNGKYYYTYCKYSSDFKIIFNKCLAYIASINI